MIKDLNNWGVVSDEDPYCPPELQYQYLVGDFNGKRVQTSRIVNVDGNLITTKNSTYRLLEPAKDYIEYLKSKNIELPTREEPIRWITQ